MEQNEIIEGNKLIAEFMGYKNIHSPNWYAMDDENVRGFYIDDTFSYNTSWAWLMPVVEKIESIDNNYQVEISLVSCTIFSLDKDPFGEGFITESHFDSKILAVWQAVKTIELGKLNTLKRILISGRKALNDY